LSGYLTVAALCGLLTACGKNDAKSPAAPGAGKAGAGNTGAATASANVTPDAIRAAIARGVAYLRGKAENGVWSMQFGGQKMPSPASTALATTAIAQSLPPAERAKDPLVQQAAKFMLSTQRDDGAIDTGGTSKYENYFTSAVLMALDVIDDPAQAGAREKMKDFLLSLQRLEDGPTQGGFGYNTAGSADLSNAQFAIEALRTAGIPEDHPAMQRALRYLERVQNRSENEANRGASYEVEDKQAGGKVTVVPGDDGSAGYEPGVSKAGLRKLPDGTYAPRGYGSMTYALLKCYLLVGLQPDDARVKDALTWLGDNYTWDENPGFMDIARETNQPEAPYWGLFYYYMTAGKALALSGLDEIQTPDGPRDWRKDLAAAILARQGDDGSWINSKAPRWEEADSVIVTAYALIALEDVLGAMES